jgi:tetratricopeptide (TPR) repeat protein
MTLRKIASFAGAVLAIATLSSPVLAEPGGGGSSNSSSQPDLPSMSEVEADLDAGRWTDAISKLKEIVADETSNAEGYNLLGYAYRKSGNLDLAQRYYTRALRLDPKHKGALEYQGELFVMLGQVDKAKANLDKIEELCGNTTCSFYKNLAKAIG